jgi:Spy/CpxP family protein refolding chaperone
MKKKTILATTLLAAGLWLSWSGIAQAGAFDTTGHAPRFYNNPRALQRVLLRQHAQLQVLNTLIQLDFSEAQKTEIADILKANRSAIRAMQGSLRNAFLQLAKEVTEYDADEQAIRTASDALARNVEEFAVFKSQLIQDIRAVMDDRQIAILMDKRENLLRHMQSVKARTPRHKAMQTLDLWIDQHSSK